MDKKLIYGTFSTVAVMIVIIILVFVNLVAEKINFEADLTSEEMYSISDKSKEALRRVEKDISIFVLSETGKEDATIRQILNEYSSNCPKLTVEYKDPYIYPTFAKSFVSDGEDIETDSIIVQCGDKSKIISPDELYETRMNYTTGGYTVTGISAEAEITNAVYYVSMDKTPVIYYVSGHNETEVSPTLKSEFEKMNYDIKNLNIVKDGGIPEDCDMLLITTPAVDYSDDEKDAVLSYLAKDGRAAVFVDWGTEKPNLNSILSAYGVRLENSIIVEGDKNNYYNNPIFLIPNVQNSDVTRELVQSDYPMIVPYAQGVSQTELKKNSITVESLLKTSNSAYSKISDNPESINFEEGDKNGPFDLAVAVTDSYYTDTNHTTKLVVCGSSLIIRDEGYTPASLMFAVNAANWLKDEETSIYIPSKSLEQDTIMIPDGTKSTITMFVCGFIPVFILGSGAVVWYKRRYS